MFDDRFATASDEELLRVQGAFTMPASARWIMQRESGGRTHAKNPHSSAFGAFQMIKANRKHYMGANWQSTDLGAQFASRDAEDPVCVDLELHVHARESGWHRRNPAELEARE